MKLRTSFLTRFLALALALVMIASSANLGLVARVFAATGSEITDGELVAKNYDLSDAEKALLESGLLKEQTHQYQVPADDDGLVTVDPEKKTVEASSFENWKPVSAKLTASDGTEEAIALEDGKGSFEYDGNAYTVFVTYEATIDVDTTVQTTLLSTAGWLKAGTANIDKVAGVSGSLSLLEEAMPALVDLANNGYLMGGKPYQLSAEVKAAIQNLNNQMTANGGKLDLTVMLDEFAQNKTKFVLTKGTDLLEEVNASTQRFEVIYEPMNFISGMAAMSPDIFDATQVSQITLAANTLNRLKTELPAATAGDWTAAEKGTELVKSGITDAEYAKLDSLVAALGATSDVTVAQTLNLGTATVKVSTSMADVTITIKLSHYVNGALTDAETFEETVTLAQGATKADVETEVNNVEQVAIQAYQTAGIDLNHFETKIECSVEDWTNGLPEGEHTYTVTYAPKMYTVTYDYQDSEEVAYGVQITLPRHADSSKAYDYTVNGTAYAQGSVITVEGPTAISREEGKAYTTNKLLAVIVNNGYGNAKTNAILSSGALYGDENIAVRYPDANKGKLADFKEGSDTVIATKPYAADYNGLSWKAYKYVVDNGSEQLFGNKTEATVGAFKTSVQVYFRLTLDNYGAETTQKWMDLAVTLEDEAKGQKATVDALASSHETMGQLDKTKLGALNGVIDVTDFTPDDGNENDAETKRLRTVFKDIVSSIINNHLDPNNKLKIYNMLGEYNANGLIYYYTNYDEFKNEIDKLSNYLNGLLEEEEALKIMVTAAGFPEYAEKINGLGETLDTANANLSAPNAAINLKDATKLAALVTALTMDGTAGTAKAVAAPYLDDNAPHTVEAKGYKGITVTVKIKDQNGLSVSKSWTVEHILTEDDVAELKAEVNSKIAELLGDDAAYYTGSYTGAELDALVGTVAGEITKVAYEYEWTLKTVYVDVPGMDKQPVTKNNATISLAPSQETSVRYDYYIDGVKIEGSTYAFTAEQLAAIFAGNAPVITVEKIDLGQETFNNFVENLNAKIGRPDAAVYKDGTLTVNITTAELQGFVMGLAMDSGYSYIGLGGEGLVYLNEGGSLEISIQTLMNAVLNENFSNATVIDLADGTGTLTTTTMELGNDKAGATAHPFVLKLSGIPAEASKVAEILELGYIKLNGTSDNELNIELNLPEKLYQAYLTALIATGEVDLDNVEEVNNTIAVQFLWDYIGNGEDSILGNSAITTETYENTLKKLGREYDLSQYEDYYQKARTAVQKYLVVENGQASIDFVDTADADGNCYVKKLMDKVLSGSDMGTLLNMIKEYKGGLEISANVTVKGIINNYEALIVDNGKSGVTNKFDYVKEGELAGTTISGAAVVILLKDAVADLTFPATAILDLNGFALTGDVESNGNLFIIDSTMNTFGGGSVTGDVSGNVTVLGGTYSDDVTSFLKEGYVQENGAVSNSLYTIAVDGDGNITFNINADIYQDVADGNIPSVKALGIDIAADLVLNYFTAAYLELDGNKIYGVALDDMVAILEGEGTDGKLDAVIEDVLNSVSAPEISVFVNQVIADLLNFQKISETVGSGSPVATYTLTTAPWDVKINHVEAEDYLTVGIGYGEQRNSVNVNIAIVGENAATDKVKELTAALAEIVTKTDIAVNMDQPTYIPGSNTFNVTGTAKTIVEVDLTKNEHYTTILAVILANGTGKTSYIDAINAGDMAALKTAVDNTSVADVIASLKALNRNESFADIADGVEIEIGEAAELEAIYHIFLCGAGKVLERFDVTGGDSKLGALAKEDGWYVLDKDNDVVRVGDAAARGYTVKYDLTLTDLSISVKVFGESEPPVVEVAPIVVTDTEGTEVYTGSSFLDAIAAVKEGYTVTINENVVADGGANVICSFNVVGADKLDMGTNYLTISNLDHKITSDADTLNVAANVDGYKADYVDGAYQLVEFAVYANVPTVAACWHMHVTDGETGALTRYMFLDLPIEGMMLNDLAPSLTVEGMEDKDYAVSIDGYNDGDLIQTGDVMKVVVMDGQKSIAFITYTVIVSGDANANGMIDVGDAVTMQTIYTNNVEGRETDGITFVKMLAADANKTGEIDVGDAVRVQTKWTLITEADDKEAAWLEWIGMITPVVE